MPRQRFSIFVLVFILIAAAACSPRASGTPVTPEPTASVAPSPAVPTPTAQAQQPGNEYAGFVVYDQAQGMFTGYAFDGSALNLAIPAPGIEFHPDLVQVVGDAVYYWSIDKTLMRADMQSARKLDGVPTDHLSAFRVSPDETRLAWSSDFWDQTPPYSELWIANLDGSSARRIATSTTDTSGELLLPKPYRWMADGKLLYTEIPTGIGGYILYQAWNSLHLYDPAGDQSRPLHKPASTFVVCLSGVAPDLSHVALGCSEEGAGKVSLVSVADGASVRVPDLPEQGQAGSAKFSPSGAWLAYAIARGDPENERGQVAVIPVDQSAAPVIIASQDGAFFDVVDWIGEDTLLLFLTREGLGSVWRVNRDGSGLAQLATGNYVVGLIKTAQSVPTYASVHHAGRRTR